MRNARFAVTTLLLLATLTIERNARTSVPVPLNRPLSSIPLEWQGFQGRDEITQPGELARLLPTSHLNRTYQRGALRIGLFIAHFEQQEPGALIHSPRTCLPLGAWEIAETGSIELRTGGIAETLNSFLIQRGQTRHRMIYWYQSRDHLYASEYAGKLFMAFDRLRHVSAGSFVRVHVESDPESERLAQDFAAWIIPAMRRCLGNK